MARATTTTTWEPDRLRQHLVRYDELRPCTTAFIDTRTPGSAEKENFTIIGPGVAESPDQFVHIDRSHGFNIGGARQPPNCVNSQHSHETAEVFVIHTGTWAFYLGPNREDGEVVLGPGDVISIPVHVFRGFANVGDDVGFMFAVLGGDDPGRVTWAPYVFEQARKYGLVLLDDGSLVDTTVGESIPPGKKAMLATTEQDVRALRRMRAAELEECVFRHDELEPSETSPGDRALECPIIGAASSNEKLGPGKLAWKHGFSLRHVRMPRGSESPLHRRDEEEVLLVHKGRLSILLDGDSIAIGPGDVFTVPIGLARTFRNDSTSDAEYYVVRGGDHPLAATVLS